MVQEADCTSTASLKHTLPQMTDPTEAQNNMDKQECIITFVDASVADATRYASELRESLLEANPYASVEQRRDDPNSQDLGTTLVLVFGSQFAVAIAQGIRSWLAKRDSARLTIKTPKGTILLENVNAKDAAEITKALVNRRKSSQ